MPSNSRRPLRRLIAAVLQGQVLVGGAAVLEAAVEAKNGRLYVMDGVLVPPSITPVLPHRCDVTETRVVKVRTPHIRPSLSVASVAAGLVGRLCLLPGEVCQVLPGPTGSVSLWSSHGKKVPQVPAGTSCSDGKGGQHLCCSGRLHAGLYLHAVHRDTTSGAAGNRLLSSV